MKVRIITDDYTSATDGVVAFAEAGWSAGVVLAAARDEALHALSVDTESRATSGTVAANVVSKWAKTWTDANLLVKQFDSTLRGNVAVECAAAWRASGRDRLLIVPSFPFAGRTTVAGRVLLNGIPLEQTTFGQDPVNPVTESSIPEAFLEVGIRIHVAGDAEQAKAAFTRGESVVCVDTATDEELRAIVLAFFRDDSLVWAGSTGLVRAMAETLPSANGRLPLAQVPRALHPWVLIGSRNPLSRVQARVLADELPEVAIQMTSDVAGDPCTAATDLVESVIKAMASGACDGFVATGGDTAKALSDAIGATGITVIREVEPGIPLTILHTSRGDLPLITKAGGFGDAETLVRCVRALHGT